MLSWRDMKNPLKGGAEVVTDIYLKGLAKMGHNVDLFASSFKGGNKSEIYNGYRIIRQGGKYSVYIKGINYAQKNLKNYDYIIDQINTIPFFTPLFVPAKKRVAFFHQLAMDVWLYESPFPLSLLGIAFEWLYLKLYHNTRSFVVSQSTKNDLIKYALAKPKNVLVLKNQIDFPCANSLSEKEDAFCVCGRLKKSKRFHHAIRSLSLVPLTKLYVIGEGDEKYKLKLKRLADKLGLSKRVIFTGKVSFEERNKIMARCLAIIVPSVREGWGLIVTEANANGTLAITYDVPGLRDANKKGIVCKRKNYKSLAKNIVMLRNNKDLVKDLSLASLEHAREHCTWSNQVERLYKWIQLS